MNLHNKNAFTLIELLVTMVISSIIGLSVLGIYSLSVRSFDVAKNKQIAMENARTSLEQIAEWVKWGGYEFESAGTAFAGIYPCKDSPTDTGSGGACGIEFNRSFGIITKLNNIDRRLNFYFLPDNDTDFPNDAFLMMDIIDITDPAFPVINTVVISDGILMPGTNIPGSNPPLNAPEFVEFYTVNNNLITPATFPLDSLNAFGRGVLIKISLVGINWNDSGDGIDFTAVPYTVTVYTRNFMK